MNTLNNIEGKEIVDFLSDSRVWKKFLDEDGFAPGDIVIVDPFKAGTTWTQRIIEQILNNGEESSEDLSDKSPWLDSSWGNHQKMIDKLRLQKNASVRRVIKSHLPSEVVPICPDVRYIFVGRNGKDIVCSFHNYLKNFNQETVELINQLYHKWSGKDEKMEIPEKSADFFDLWMDMGDKYCDILHVTRSWWDVKEFENVMMLHYNELLHDLENQIARLAKFIEVDPGKLNLQKIAEHCNFNYMKQRSDRLVPFSGKHMTNSKSFFHKGPERDYKNELSPDQIKRYNIIADEKSGAECALWLETGKLPDVNS
ncbi:MAG: sulfotransferase domain-containing protein [Spirochaetia bacterium]|nr:sulfotransferase domain-containing protein [Spirochaetia bacterium]